MTSHLSRRSFLAGAGCTALAASLPLWAREPGAAIRFGYTAMTWGNEEHQAIEDIAAVGFPGIQFRANALTEFKPSELRDLLAQHKLTFVALSSGDISLDEPAADQIAKHVANAQFVRDAGGLYLQILDQLKSYPRDATPDECRRLGQMLNEVGKRTADLGVPLGYHNHLNTLSQKPGNLDLILANTDPRFVKLELDTAHSVAGGGDPAQQIAKYHDRLLFVHLKDVVDLPTPGSKAKYPFQFVELGRGRVDFRSVFAALDRVGFHGWAVVELDRVPDNDRTPKQCATISYDFLRNSMHRTV